MNGQLGQRNLGTFDLGKLFKDPTPPVNNHCLFMHVKTNKKNVVHLIGK